MGNMVLNKEEVFKISKELYRDYIVKGCNKEGCDVIDVDLYKDVFGFLSKIPSIDITESSKLVIDYVIALFRVDGYSVMQDTHYILKKKKYKIEKDVVFVKTDC